MACPQCGRENPADARFCNACGAPLASAREERRLVTVVFADVTASTELASRLDPESLRRLLARFYELARGAVTEHGGTLEKFIGDAVMAVFGIPQAHDDDAERAVRAALTLHDAVAADPELSRAMSIRVGVNTGEVVGAVGATGDFIVTGEPVNLAARLQQSAEDATVLVGDRTARATEGRIRYEGPLAVRVKGKSEPLVAWRALQAREMGARGLRARTALLGRDDDVALLRVLVRRAFSEARVHIVTVVAPAGVGKSRLVGEFLDALELDATRPRVGRTLCLPYGTSLAYGALRGALRTLAGSVERADAMLAQAGLDERAREAILVAAGLSQESGRPIPRDELARAWRDLFRSLATDRPLVIFCDDLHWASESLLALIEDVVRLPLEAPVVLLFATRPDLFDRHPSWPTTKRDAGLIQLRPLSDSDIEWLVASLGAGGLSTESRARIVRRAEGNPFFAEEMARAALSEQDVEGALPDSVQAAILARLDQLSSEERRIVQAAAVVGRPFTPDHLRAVDPALEGTAIETIMATLAERELIAPLDQTRSLFRHTLIRDVAVGTLPRRELAGAHERLATWLAAQGDGESAELAAVHLVEALELRDTLGMPLDGALRRRAVEALTRAADRAFQLYATSLAKDHLERALSLSTTETERLQLLERLGDAIARETPSETAAEKYREALAIWESLGAGGIAGARLHRKLALLMARWPGAFRTWPTPDEIEALATRAMELCEGDVLERGLALAALSIAKQLRGEYDAALQLLAEARAALADSGDANALGIVDDATRSAFLRTGALTRFYEHAKANVARAEQLAMDERVEAYGDLSYGSELLWRIDEALAANEHAIELATTREVGHPRLHALQRGISLAAKLDQWDRAVALGDALQREWERQGEVGAACNSAAAAAIAEIHVRRGAGARAAAFDATLENVDRPSSFLVRRLRLAGDCRAIGRLADRLLASRSVQPGADPFTFVEFLEGLLQCDDEERLERVRAHAPAEMPEPCLAQARRAEARVALRRGDIDRARAGLRESLTRWRALGLRWEAAHTSVLLAALVEAEEGERLRADAREVFASLGDRISLAQLDAVPAT